MNRSIKTVNIMGVEIAAFNYDDLFDYVYIGLKEKKRKCRVIGKCPSEFIKRAVDNKDFREALSRHDLNIADGIGVLWAAKYSALPITNKPVLRQIQAFCQMILTGAGLIFRANAVKTHLPERLSGVEAFYKMMEAAQKAGKGVYLFGARKAVIEKSVKIIKEKNPDLIIAGFHEGYNFDDRVVRKEINDSGAELLIVALGSPKQEYWIRDNVEYLKSVKIAVGEGGSFDAICGATRRAPKWVQKINLEWLWRGLVAKNLTTDAPPRIIRIWRAVPSFISDVVKWKIKNG